MADDLLMEQASRIASILPRLMRRFNAFSEGDPAMELPIAQLRLCSHLHDGARAMSCLARELGISLSAVTQIADRLERAELIERVSEVDDRRVKTLKLTPRGEDLMRARRENRTRRILDAIGPLSPDKRASVLGALRLLLEASPAPVMETEEDVTEPPVT